MRVAQLITQDSGGPVDHAVDVAIALVGMGHDSHLFGPAGPYVASLEEAGVTWHPLEISSTRDVTGMRAFAAGVKALGPDVLHGQDRRGGLVTRLVGAAQRRPVVATMHGVPDNLSTLVAGNIRAASPSRKVTFENLYVERGLARLPRTRLVVPAQAIADYAEKHVHVPRERIRVVHNGVTPSWRDLGTAHHDRAQGEKVRAVWLGGMAPVKRLPHLVRAVALVPDLQLRLIGDGPERPSVEHAARASGADVEFAGFHAAPAPYLLDADFFVLPSAAEACPMAILQAMALGLPIVASRAGGIPEIVRHGVDGILVPTGDDGALRTALERMTRDQTMRERLGRNARERALKELTVEACAEKLVAVYREVVDG